MYEPTELFTVMALAIFVMGLFVSFIVICGVANAREELKQATANASPKKQKQARPNAEQWRRRSDVDFSRN